MDEALIRKWVIRAVIGLLGLIVFFSSYFTVEQYERGVVKTWGKVSYIADPGIGFKVPFVQSVTYYRTDMQQLQPDKAVNTYTVDNQEVDIIFTVFYRIPVDKIACVYQNVQDYANRLFSLSIDRAKSEMGKVNVAHVAEQRGAIRDRIHKILANDARALCLEVTDFQLTNIEYTKGYKAAVEQQAVARQMVDTKQRQLEQAEKDAQTARVTAQGKADSQLAIARAEAEAVKLRGDAEASAIRAKQNALQQSQQLVELTKAERWDGKLPVQMLSGVTPFMQFNAPK